MSGQPLGPRASLVRGTLVFQVKLLADGLRDAVLLPLSLLAALAGLLRGGPDADRELRQLIRLGRRSERWINLFGHRPPLRRARPGRSLDAVLDHVEAVVMEQYRKSATADEARAAIAEALAQEAGSEPTPGERNDSV